MDPWLSQRYGGVRRSVRTRASSVRAQTPSRRAWRDADRLLDARDRELRARRARRRATVLIGAISAAVATVLVGHALGLL